MSTNGFREDELVTRTMNGQSRVFPVVGGRLRLAHENNEKLSLRTELISWDGRYAVFRCTATTIKGQCARRTWITTWTSTRSDSTEGSPGHEGSFSTDWLSKQWL